MLEKTSIYSPIDGIISLLSVKLGERVVATGQFAGTEVMRVADLGKMEARVNVNENDVVNVKINDEANISIDAYPGRTFRGTVYQIANTAVTTRREHAGGSHEFRGAHPHQRRGRAAASGHERDRRHRNRHRARRRRRADPVRDRAQPRRQAQPRGTRQDKSSRPARPRRRATPIRSNWKRARTLTDRDKAERKKMQKVVFVKTKDNTVQMRPVETGIADNT